LLNVVAKNFDLGLPFWPESMTKRTKRTKGRSCRWRL